MHTMQEQLSDPNFTTVRAMLALRAAGRALVRCKGGDLEDCLAAAERHIRDAAVLATQCEVPLVGSRESFVLALQAAYGGYFEKNELARFMHAYAQVVCPRFPQQAFASKAKQQHPRPRKRRSRRCPQESRQRERDG